MKVFGMYSFLFSTVLSTILGCSHISVSTKPDNPRYIIRLEHYYPGLIASPVFINETEYTFELYVLSVTANELYVETCDANIKLIIPITPEAEPPDGRRPVLLRPGEKIGAVYAAGEYEIMLVAF